MSNKVMSKLDQIRLTCEQRLAEVYTAGIPSEVQVRYENEIAFLEASKYVEQFEVYRLLADAAHEDGFPLYGRGTLMGSLIYFLLGHGRFNPMQAHYYCPHCGHYEFVPGHVFGVDLQEKTCPECGRKIWADGFDLPLESVWGINGKKRIAFEFNIAPGFRHIAEKVLREHYADQEIIVKGGYAFRWDEEEEFIVPSGFIILPKGKNAKSFTEYLQYSDEGEACFLGNPLRMTDLGMVVITLINHAYVDQLHDLRAEFGDTDLIGIEDLKKIGWRDIYDHVELSEVAERLFKESRPKSIREMVNLETFSHAMLTDGEAEAIEISEKSLEVLESAEFKKHPCYTREDFFEMLLEDGVDTDIAFEAMEIFRKGWFSNSKRIEKCNDLGLTREYENLASKFGYIFPRAHGVEYMLMYARLVLAKRKV